MTERDLGPMAQAVDTAIAAATLRPEDAGAVELVRRYAALIDAATPSSVYARHIRAVARALDIEDRDAADSMRKIEEALAAHAVASDLGPKLLAALSALGLTVASRAAKGGESGGGISARLDEFTAARARKHPA